MLRELTNIIVASRNEAHRTSGLHDELMKGAVASALRDAQKSARYGLPQNCLFESQLSLCVKYEAEETMLI